VVSLELVWLMNKIRVIYKNGHIEEFMCAKFAVRKTTVSGTIEVEWEDAWPNPLLFGIDDVMAIYEIDAEEK